MAFLASSLSLLSFFSARRFPPLFLFLLSHNSIPSLHHFDRQITITIRFVHTRAYTRMHTRLQSQWDPVCCQPLRIIGHLHHPLLSSVFRRYPSIPSALLSTSILPSINLLPPICCKAEYILPPLFLPHRCLHTFTTSVYLPWMTEQTGGRLVKHVHTNDPASIFETFPPGHRRYRTLIKLPLQLHCAAWMHQDAISLVVSMSLMPYSRARMH